MHRVWRLRRFCNPRAVIYFVKTELSQEKIQRLVGAFNISVPPLPSAWRVTDVQVQPWQGRQSLVVTATTQALGQVTLVAAPMGGEDAVPLTLATDGRGTS